MKATTAVGVALVLALAGVTARADEGGKVKVTFRPQWKAGEIFTHTSEETENESVKVLTADGQVLSDDSKVTLIAAVYVVKCVAADAAGHLTKGIVHFSEFSLTVGKEKDETLQGRTYEINGVGKARKIVSMDSGKSESEAAMAWLAKNLGAESRSDERDDLLSPKKESAAGDVVEVPMKAAAEMFPLPIDVEKSSGKVTIEAVGADSMTATFEMTLETKGLPNVQTGALMAWAEGGKATIKGRRSAKPDGSPAPSESEEDFELAGTTADQGGYRVVFKTTSKETQKTIAGGELPKAPEPAAPPAPAPDKPAPDKPEPEKPAPEKPPPDKPEK